MKIVCLCHFRSFSAKFSAALLGSPTVSRALPRLAPSHVSSGNCLGNVGSFSIFRGLLFFFRPFRRFRFEGVRWSKLFVFTKVRNPSSKALSKAQDNGRKGRKGGKEKKRESNALLKGRQQTLRALQQQRRRRLKFNDGFSRSSSVEFSNCFLSFFPCLRVCQGSDELCFPAVLSHFVSILR